MTYEYDTNNDIKEFSNNPQSPIFVVNIGNGTPQRDYNKLLLLYININDKYTEEKNNTLKFP